MWRRRRGCDRSKMAEYREFLVIWQAQRLTTTEEILGYHHCRENGGGHVLGQRRRHPHPLRRPQAHDGGACAIRKRFEDEVSSSIAEKMAGKGLCRLLPSRQSS